MFDYVMILIEEFIEILPEFATIFLALGIAGNLVFRK